MEATQATVGNGQRQNTPATPEPVNPPRQRKQKTPKSMVPKIAPEMAQATKETLREGDLDVPQLVADVVTSKASMGQSFTGRKAGQPINAAVAAAAKRKLGLEPNQHLSDKLWKSIQTETQKFLDAKIELATKDYPELVSVRLNRPTIRVKDGLASDFLWQSQVNRARKAKDLGDEKVGLNEILRASKDRLEYMLGKRKVNGQYVQPSKTYTREEIAKVEARIAAIDKRIAAINRELKTLVGNGSKGKSGKSKGK